MKVVIFVILSLVTYCSAQAYTLTATDRTNFLNSHNQVRDAYGVPRLTWSSQLETDSAAYAALCKINPLTHSSPPSSNPYGENLSYYMVSPQPASFPYQTSDWHVTTPQYSWYAEEPDYNCPANTCNSGKMCGHLTQLVWRDTTTVGCGLAKCSMVSGSTTFAVQNAVCRYQPPGNMNGNSPLTTNAKTTTLCPSYPTTLKPLSPAPPTAPTTTPTAPTTTPTAPKAPTTTPTAPTTTPTAPKAPTTPTAPKTPAPVPTAPIPTAPGASGTWWAKCTCSAPTGTKACAWEPWLSDDTDSTGKTVTNTWCCPNAANQYDYSYLVNNKATTSCPDGKATYLTAEETADAGGGLSMGAWIGIAIGIAVAIIIVIVIIVVVKKKKDDERV